MISVMGLRWTVYGGLARLRQQILRRLAASRLKPYCRSVATGPSIVSDLLDRLKTALADRYAIEREIGAGGMATVYLADKQNPDGMTAGVLHDWPARNRLPNGPRDHPPAY